MVNSPDTPNAGARRRLGPPRLIFLDTNVVQNLASFGEFIDDKYLSPESRHKLNRLGPRVADDIHALAELMDVGRRRGLPMIISSRTRDELASTPNSAKRARLEFYGADWFQYSSGLLETLVDEPESAAAG